MTIIASVFALAGRFLGRVLTMALGDLLALRARAEARPSPAAASAGPSLVDRAVAAVLASGFGVAAALLGRLLPDRAPADDDEGPGASARSTGPERRPGVER